MPQSLFELQVLFSLVPLLDEESKMPYSVFALHVLLEIVQSREEERNIPCQLFEHMLFLIVQLLRLSRNRPA